MFAAMLLAISIVALSQFALYYWRAILAGVAAQPVSERVLAAANLDAGRMEGRDFEKVAGLHEVTAELSPSGGGEILGAAYYRGVGGARGPFGWVDPWGAERVAATRRMLRA